MYVGQTSSRVNGLLLQSATAECFLLAIQRVPKNVRCSSFVYNLLAGVKKPVEKEPLITGLEEDA